MKAMTQYGCEDHGSDDESDNAFRPEIKRIDPRKWRSRPIVWRFLVPQAQSRNSDKPNKERLRAVRI